MTTSPTTPSLAKLLTTELRQQLDAALPSFLSRQRWFGGKSRPIRAAHIASITPFTATAALATIAVNFTDGITDLYQLPLAIASQSPGSVNAILTTFDFDGSPLYIVDATVDPAFRHALLEAIYDPTDIPDLLAHHASSLDAAALLATESRVGSAEQSNTSILFGESAILKLFRRLTPGENPDVEVGRFLAAAGFTGIPAYLGDLTLAVDGTTLSYLQSFAPNHGDGWSWFLAELTSVFTAIPASTADSSTPAGESTFRSIASATLDAAALLGRRTAEMHLALAAPNGALSQETATAFAAEPYTSAAIKTEIARIAEQANYTLAALADALPTLAPDLVEKARTLLAARDRILAHIAGLQSDPAQFGQRIRIHGDYHLGQLLRTANDFLIVDFEGEPAKSLQARRTKQTPLKDVAGMLRSFNYVAQSARSQHPNGQQLGDWAIVWERTIIDVFLRAYRATLATHPSLLPRSSQANALLLALLIEKALYELVYELNNRPTWLYLPLEGLLSLVDRLPS